MTIADQCASQLLNHDRRTNPLPICCRFETTVTSLQANFHSTFVARSALGERRQQVCDIIPRMSVETSAQPLLVEIVGNQTNAAAQHEKAVENTHVKVVFGFFGGEGTAVTEEVDKTDSDCAVNVENEIVLLGSCDSLDGDGIVEQLVAGEVLSDELLYELDTKIGVGA